jgi:hypothetical protein
MALSEKAILAVLAGVGGAVALYYLLRTPRTRHVTPPVRDEPVSKMLNDPTPAPPAENSRVERIIDLQSKLGLASVPDAELVAELTGLLSEASESELEEIKANAEYASFMVSEWVFYHTLRSKKSVHWDSVTGMMGEGLSPQERDLGRRIADTMRKAYWDKHLEDLSKPVPEYKHILDRLSELQSRIRGFQKAKDIEVFDLDLIKQTIATNSFDRPFFISIIARVIEVLNDLESPAAHEQTAAWFASELFEKDGTNFHIEIVESLKFLFAQLDLLDAEMANYKATLIALESKRKKERELFHSLVTERVIEVPNLRTHLPPLPAETALSFASLNQHILTNWKAIIVKELMSESHKLPESLFPDISHFSELRKRVFSSIRLATVFVAVHSQLQTFPEGKSFLAQPNSEITLFTEALADLVSESECSGSEIVSFVSDRISAFTNQPLAEKILADLHKGLDQCCSETSQVRQLYVRRVAALLEKGLNEATATVASNALGSKPFYLSMCAKQISEIINECIEYLAEHLHVYLPIYRDIVTSNL